MFASREGLNFTRNVSTASSFTPATSSDSVRCLRANITSWMLKVDSGANGPKLPEANSARPVRNIGGLLSPGKPVLRRSTSQTNIRQGSAGSSMARSSSAEGGSRRTPVEFKLLRPFNTRLRMNALALSGIGLRPLSGHPSPLPSPHYAHKMETARVVSRTSSASSYDQETISMPGSGAACAPNPRREAPDVYALPATNPFDRVNTRCFTAPTHVSETLEQGQTLQLEMQKARAHREAHESTVETMKEMRFQAPMLKETASLIPEALPLPQLTYTPGKLSAEIQRQEMAVAANPSSNKGSRLTGACLTWERGIAGEASAGKGGNKPTPNFDQGEVAVPPVLNMETNSVPHDVSRLPTKSATEANQDTHLHRKQPSASSIGGGASIPVLNKEFEVPTGAIVPASLSHVAPSVGDVRSADRGLEPIPEQECESESPCHVSPSGRDTGTTSDYDTWSGKSRGENRVIDELRDEVIRLREQNHILLAERKLMINRHGNMAAENYRFSLEVNSLTEHITNLEATLKAQNLNLPEPKTNVGCRKTPSKPETELKENREPSAEPFEKSPSVEVKAIVLPFNAACLGDNLSISSDGYQILRKDGYSKSLAVGTSALERTRHGQWFQVVVEAHDTSSRWVGGLGLGVTLSPEDILEKSIDKSWKIPNTITIGYWGRVFCYGKEYKSQWNPDTLQNGDTVGFLVTPTGSIALFVNSILQDYVDVQLPIIGLSAAYPIVDVFGSTSSIMLVKNPGEPPALEAIPRPLSGIKKKEILTDTSLAT